MIYISILSNSEKTKQVKKSDIKIINHWKLTATEVIDVIIQLSKEIFSMDCLAKNFGLTDFEYTLYIAVSDNESARELMAKDNLREPAVVLRQTIRQNASIDWKIKESIIVKLKITVKRILWKYGYPPDK